MYWIYPCVTFSGMNFFLIEVNSRIAVFVKRPYVIVSNEIGTKNSTIITVMPLTHIIKKTYMPVHECLEVESDNGLSVYSMILGEQPQTISKDEVQRKVGTITNENQKNMINKVCYNTFFFGENINWEEVLK